MDQLHLSLRRRLARLLWEKSYREGEFLLTSGRKSDYYFDCKQTALHPEGAWLLGRLLFELIVNTPVEAVAGPTLGADPLVTSVAMYSHDAGRPLPAMIVRKESKGHGTNQFLEGLGNVKPGAAVVVLEDVVTTGGSLLKACERVKSAGFVIPAVACVLDREEGGTEAIRDNGYEFLRLFNRAELLEDAK